MSYLIRGTFLAACALSATAAFAVDFGRTAGSFGVSPSGAATYSIPIWTPPGPNGLTPSISVSYDSLGGNGLAGVGWNLSAVSAIERCNRTKHQDGAAAPIELTLNDRFCIGGARLRVVSGSYGAAGSVYYTELADYSRITAYGTAGNGPQYFIVEAKSGLKYEYGATTSSRVVLGSTALRWMLNKVYDRNGNNYIISYNNATGFAVPDVVSWTPTSLGAGTYRYEAKFNYSNSRTDKDSYIGNVAGNSVINRYRLESIQIKSAAVVIRKYRFVYGTSSVTSRSRLTSAKECADDAESNCLLPIALSYQTGQAGVTTGAGTPPAGSSNGIVQRRYDLNGDGKDDILYMSGALCYAALGANNGFTSPISTGASSCGLVDRFLPSGRDAILLLGSPVQAVYWNDATSSFATASLGFNQAATSVIAADYDGDGLADLAYPSGTVIVTRRNTSTGVGAPSFAASTLSSASLATISGASWGSIWPYFGTGVQRSDFNGDGSQDINGVYAVSSGMGATVYYIRLYGYSGGFYAAGTPVNTVSVPITFPALNFNGDACSDVRIGSNIQISPCNTTATSNVALPATPLQFLDWDGDGKTDLLADNGGNFAVYLSTGTAFSGPVATSISSTGIYFPIDQDGDRQDDLIKVNGTSAISYWTHTSSGSAPTYATNIPDLLSSVTDGYGVTHVPGYVSTAWGSYDKGAATNFPLQESDPRIVVAQATSSNGIGGTFNKTYFYVGARDHAERGGFVGFQRINETDSRNGLISRTYFEQTFPVSGMVSQMELMQPNGVTPIRREVFTNNFTALDATANNQRYFQHVSASTATQYEVGGIWNGALLRTVTTANSFETTGGTLYDQTVTTTEPASGANGVTAGGQWTARTYLPTVNLLNDPGNWCLGRPQLIQQINSSNLTYGTAITRTTNVTWNASFCRPTQTVDEQGSGTLQVTTALGYDGFGNVNSTTVTGVGMTARTTTTSYSNATFTTGQFPLSVTNALSQTSTMGWDYNLGVPTSMTDPNGIPTGWLYDPYGRRVRQNFADTTYKTWDYLICSTCGPLVHMYVEEHHREAGSTSFAHQRTYMDAFDRPIDVYSRRMDGTTYNVAKRTFDALGNVLDQYLPFVNTLSPVGTVTNIYDLINRPTEIRRPVSDAGTTPTQSTLIYYEGLTTRIVDAQSKVSYRIANAAGMLARSTDHDNYYQSFDYDPFGGVKRVQDSAGNTLQSSSYNTRGMLTSRTDLDMGTWTYLPNALGEVTGIRDPKTSSPNWTQVLSYDLLGRPTTRVESEGTTTRTWGTSSAAKNIGQLASISGPGYSETYSYDSIGRPSSTSISADTSYQIDYSYNSLGMLGTLTYPTSTSSYRLKLQYEYQNGQLYRIKDFNAPSTVFWTANAVNARNQLTQETLGNGLVTNRAFDAVTGWLKSIQTGVGGGTGVQNLEYAWDKVGNLSSRKDKNQSNLTESFFYDNLYRLDYSHRNGVENLNLAYDALGNITSKSDVGSYAYHATKKHQVISTGSPTSWSFAYDANGNMTSGRGATIDWTSYNYPSCIRLGASCTGTSTDYSLFSYTPDRQYWRQISNYTSGGTATTIYVGGLVEKVTTSAGTDYRHMIRAGGSTIIVSRQSSGTNSVYYATSDHLGSSSAITNASGGILANSSFDAFGKRRGSNWSGNPSAGDWTAIASTTRRGFTDHSMLDNLGLIHMNGRINDPWLGRFVSADPFITEPLNTQNYNRYSYLSNNTLNATDPSGFKKKYWRHIGGDWQIYGCGESCAGETVPFVGNGFFESYGCEAGGCAPGFDHTAWSDGMMNRSVMSGGGHDTSTHSQVDGLSGHVDPNKVGDSIQGWTASMRPDLVATPVKVSGVHCDGCNRTPLQRAFELAPNGPLLASIIGDSLAAFSQDGVNPLNGRVLLPGEQQDAKVATVLAVGGEATALARGVQAARGGGFFRGARAGETPSFTPRPNEFKVDPKTGFVKDTHGVSVFDNPTSVSNKGLVPHQVDQSSIPDSLRIIQRGQDPHHFEIVPRPGANLTPDQFIGACNSILCVR